MDIIRKSLTAAFLLGAFFISGITNAAIVGYQLTGVIDSSIDYPSSTFTYGLPSWAHNGDAFTITLHINTSITESAGSTSDPFNKVYENSIVDGSFKIGSVQQDFNIVSYPDGHVPDGFSSINAFTPPPGHLDDWSAYLTISNTVHGVVFTDVTVELYDVDGEMLLAGNNNHLFPANYTLADTAVISLRSTQNIDSTHAVFANLTNVSTFPVSTVPVPAALWLFGSGLLGLIGVAKKRKA